MALVEFLLVPYDGRRKNKVRRHLIDVLIAELCFGQWTRVRFAVAFALQSGNYPELLKAIDAFGRRPGNQIHVTFGADSFGDEGGTEHEAVKSLVTLFAGLPDAHLYLFRDKGRVFHPKVYVFDRPGTSRALVIMGSSNWNLAAMERNDEANALIRFDLKNLADKKAFAHLEETLDSRWRT